jgi:hypothetical protein
LVGSGINLKSVAEKCLEITSLFEAELLVRLMLRNWSHPFADDEEFANGLLEDASEALRNAIRGEQLIEGLPAADLNFIAAVWYAEDCAVTQEVLNSETIMARRNWLSTVRRALPSCFCNPSDLEQA